MSLSLSGSKNIALFRALAVLQPLYFAICLPLEKIKANKGNCARETATKNASRKSSQQTNTERNWNSSNKIPVFRILLYIDGGIGGGLSFGLSNISGFVDTMWKNFSEIFNY